MTHLNAFLLDSPLMFQWVIFFISIAAGFLGALLGLGGGMIIVPVLTLFFGIHIRYAIGASLIAVIATSTAAASVYVRERLANVRLSMFLEVATALGALVGALVSVHLSERVLFFTFACVLFFCAVLVFRRRHAETDVSLWSNGVREEGWAQRLQLNNAYVESGEVHAYNVQRVGLGFFLMLLAGTFSGLLGVGSGVLKVPAMDAVMRLPIKVSTATSNFMMGVTAAASAGLYFMRGDIVPFLAGPVALGVLLGSFAGTFFLGPIKHERLRFLLIGVLMFVAGQMVWRAWRGA